MLKNAYDGIWTLNSTVTGNICNENGTEGITAYQSKITGNTCNLNYNGILVGPNSIVTGNNCSNNIGYGIKFMDNANSLVDQNTAAGNSATLTGVNVNSCATCTITTANHFPIPVP